MWTTKNDRKGEKLEANVETKLRKHVGLEEPTPLLDQVYLGCTQRECKTNKMIVQENRSQQAR